MSLETATYVSDLVSTNPTSGDPKSQGDDHLRLIKSALQATFPNGDAPIYGRRAGTAVSASGASVDFTSIPSWIKQISIPFGSLSTNGTSPVIVQIGDSGGIEATGYLGANVAAQNGSGSVGTNATTGFVLVGSVADATVSHGVAILTLLNASTNLWAFSVAGANSNTAAAFSGGGSKALSATLDRVRITTVNGTDTFDAGSINIQYD